MATAGVGGLAVLERAQSQPHTGCARLGLQAQVPVNDVLVLDLTASQELKPWEARRGACPERSWRPHPASLGTMAASAGEADVTASPYAPRSFLLDALPAARAAPWSADETATK